MVTRLPPSKCGTFEIERRGRTTHPIDSNPNVSEVAKDHSRRVLEDIEGTSALDALVGEKQKQHKPEDAAEKTGNVRKLDPSPSMPSK